MSDLAVIAPRAGRKDWPHFKAPGALPRLEWLSISALRIDHSYQRTLTTAGNKNIDRIVQEFSWSKFAPCIVSDRGNGIYAIIDGQHRTIAAAERGFNKVPCMVVKLTRAEEASAFASINGHITQVHILMLYKAAVAAGEPWAVEIDSIVERAGIKIAPYPIMRERLAPNETVAIGAVRDLVKRFGPVVAEAVFCTLAQTRHSQLGHVCHASIRGLGDSIGPNPGWARNQKRLLRTFDAIPFAHGMHTLRFGEVTAICNQAFRRELGDGTGSAAAIESRRQSIRDLHGRGNSPQMIAARLRCTYSEIKAALEEEAA